MGIPGYHSGAYLTYKPFGYLFPRGDGSHVRKMEPAVGIEPTTVRLQIGRSTAELSWLGACGWNRATVNGL